MTESTRPKRVPTLAFVVTVVTGLFFTMFGIAESISGFARRPIEWSEAFGGILEAFVFGFSFLTVAWILWVRPKIGALILVVLGIGMGTWMILDWNLDPDNWYIPTILVGLPIVLGLFTLIREKGKPWKVGNARTER